MYSRFQALDKYDLEELKGSTAAIIGLGATGSVMAEHLARHGIELILIDRDYLEMNDIYSSNLYSKAQCESALPKAKAAEENLRAFVDVKAYVENFDSSKTNLLDKADIILEGTDNLETRLIIDQYSSDNSIPWVYTAALGEKGFSMFVKDKCFRCIFEKTDPADSCQENGVMREISSITAARSSMKAVRYLSGLQPDQRLEMVPEGKSFELGECGCEGKMDIEVSSVCGENKYQVFGTKMPKEFGGEVEKSNEYLKKIVFDGTPLTIFNSGRAIVETDSREEAKKVYREASSI